ncbi:MAG: mechanosensitive ion channel family protein [Saprospiraceae bacterium]|nr:mechanosensitive ion channel family protein [Saprospiraceae bacterium]
MVFCIRKTLSQFILPFFLFFLLPFVAKSQSDVGAPPVTLLNPQNTVWVHLYYLQANSYQPELAAQTITPQVADRDEAQQIAIQIKQVLDAKGLYVAIENIPLAANYMDSTQNENIYTPFPRELPAVYLKKENGKWYYSLETSQQIAKIHAGLFLFANDRLASFLPDWGKKNFLGLAIWQYIGLALLVCILALFHLILSRLLRPLVSRISRSKMQPSLVDVKLTQKIAKLLSYLVLFQVGRLLLPNLMLPIKWSQFLVVGIRIAAALLVMLILLRIVDVFMLYSKRFTESTSSRMDEQLIPIVKRLLQVVVVIGALIQILRLLEFNVTALIAGVSIGGLALALAAQDTVKNLIGSAMIFFDRPFQIGDWIEGSGFAGTVTEVGFRTTRLQQVDSSIISVPNGTIANIAVTNLGARVFRLMNIKIGIMYNTPPARIQLFLDGLRGLVIAHPKVMDTGYNIYLNEMADSSLNILFRAPIQVPDYSSELRVREEIYFGILELGEELNVSFAFPSRSLYIENPEAAESTATAAHLQTFLEKYKGKFNGPQA